MHLHHHPLPTRTAVVVLCVALTATLAAALPAAAQSQPASMPGSGQTADGFTEVDLTEVLDAAATPAPTSPPARVTPEGTAAGDSGADHSEDDDSTADANLPDRVAAFGALADRYSALSQTLVAVEALSMGATLESFVADNQVQVASTLGADIGALRVGAGFSDLNLTVATARDQMAASQGLSFVNQLPTLDAAAVTAGVQLADARARGAELVTPALMAPGAPSVQGVGAEQLAFGLFHRDSLARSTANRPDLLAEVAAGRLGDPELSTEWRRAVDEAGVVNADLADSLVAPDLAAFQLAMGAGNPDAVRSLLGDRADLDACIAAGLYMRHEITALMDPGINSLQAVPGDSTFSAGELSNLPSYLRDSFEDANPEVSINPDPLRQPDTSGGQADDCRTSRPAVERNSSAVIGGSLQRLLGR